VGFPKFLRESLIASIQNIIGPRRREWESSYKRPVRRAASMRTVAIKTLPGRVDCCDPSCAVNDLERSNGEIRPGFCKITAPQRPAHRTTTARPKVGLLLTYYPFSILHGFRAGPTKNAGRICLE